MTAKKQAARADHFMPAEVHATADRLREARALLAEAETAASALWGDYQTALRQNVKDTQTPRSAWEAACADKQSRALAVELLSPTLPPCCATWPKVPTVPEARSVTRRPKTTAPRWPPRVPAVTWCARLWTCYSAPPPSARRNSVHLAPLPLKVNTARWPSFCLIMPRT